MQKLDRRTVLTFGAVAATPLLTSTKAAATEQYGPDEGEELLPGVRQVELTARAAIYDIIADGEAAAIPASDVYIRTAGYHAVGDGGGAYYMRVDAEPGHQGKVRSTDRFLPNGSVDEANGGWWELAPGITITPRAFGAIEDTNGQEEALEAFFAWANTNSNGRFTMAHSGSYRIGRRVEVTTLEQVAFAPGVLNLAPDTTNTAVIDYALVLGQAEHCRFDQIRVIGASSGNNTFAHGVVGQRIRGSQFRKISTDNMRLFGCVITNDTIIEGISPNNNTFQIDEQWHRFNGIRGQSVAFEELSRDSTTSPTSDHSIISADLDFLYDLPIHQRGVPIKVGDHYFSISEYDSGTQEARVFPSLAVIDPSLIEDGTLAVYAGGGMLTESASVGQYRTANLNVRNSTAGIVDQSGYGGTINGLTSQLNDFAIVTGRPPATFSMGQLFIAPYFEGETELQLLVLSTLAAMTVLGVATSISKVYTTFVSASAQRRNALLRPHVNFVGKAGSFAAYGSLAGSPRATAYRRGSAWDGNSSPDEDFMGFPGGFPIFSFDNSSRTYTFNLGVENMNTLSHGSSGFAGVFVNVASGNSIVLNAPSGETIHNKSSITLTELPSHFFLVAGRASATAWIAVIDEMSSAASYISS